MLAACIFVQNTNGTFASSPEDGHADRLEDLVVDGGLTSHGPQTLLCVPTNSSRVGDQDKKLLRVACMHTTRAGTGFLTECHGGSLESVPLSLQS
jgi:hypothetical protein